MVYSLYYPIYVCVDAVIAAVDIGLQQTQFYVPMSEDYQSVCAVLQSGSTSGREIEIHYLVVDSGM